VSNQAQLLVFGSNLKNSILFWFDLFNSNIGKHGVAFLLFLTEVFSWEAASFVCFYQLFMGEAADPLLSSPHL
jgi:hypothetical protein